MNIKAFGKTDVGRVRQGNEDAILLDDDLRLYIVADGMGGHAAGEVASQTAVKTIAAEVRKHKAKLAKLEHSPTIEASDSIQNILNGAVQKACAAIYSMAENDPSKKGMGTTVSLMLILGKQAYIAHVGDSSVFIVRKGSTHKLTTDHSLVQERLDKGLLREDEAKTVSYKNLLTRAVGFHPYVDVDTLPVNIREGDVFLLASDGMTNYVEPQDYLEATNRLDPEEIPETLIEIACQRGGADNVSSVVVAVEGSADDTISVDPLISLLSQTSLFNYMEERELEKVAVLVAKKNAPRDASIIKEGSMGEHLYIISSGRVGIYRKNHLLAELGRGEHFGEMALIDSNPRSASIVAKADTSLLSVHKTALFQLMRDEPGIAVKFLWNLTQILSLRLRTTNEDLVWTRMALDQEKQKFQDVFWGDIDPADSTDPGRNRGT